MAKRFGPPRTDAERELDRAATELLRKNGCGWDGLTLDPRRARARAAYRRLTVLTPTGGKPGRGRR